MRFVHRKRYSEQPARGAIKIFELDTKKPTIQPVVFSNKIVLSNFAFSIEAVKCKKDSCDA
jgi:hypothetical protein